VLSARDPGALFPPAVQAILGGHKHVLEIVSFATAHPPQVISGNGGDWLDAPLPSPVPKSQMPASGAVVESVFSANVFGFMTTARDGARSAHRGRRGCRARSGRR